MKKVNVFAGKSKNRKTETNLVHAGRNPEEQFGFMNTPVYRASTVLFGSIDELENRKSRYTYATSGSPSSDAIIEALCYLDGAAGGTVQPSGLAAITIAIMACITHKGHILISDSVYGPTRRFCDEILPSLNVEVEYYDPLVTHNITELIKKNTQIIFIESPGSYSFEIQDIPAISQAAKAINPEIAIIADNTWAASVFCKPLQLGADIVVSALTKYVCGYSDVLMGAICANEKFLPKIKKAQKCFGICTSPDDSYLAARGMRTLVPRIKVHEKSALKVAKFLEKHPIVDEVLHPALPSFPQHALFKRDFTGSSGLFGFVCKQKLDKKHIAAICDNMELFGIGYSWGGYQSLILTTNLPDARKFSRDKWLKKGTVFRLHIGMEEPDDLIQELDDALAKINPIYDVDK